MRTAILPAIIILFVIVAVLVVVSEGSGQNQSLVRVSLDKRTEVAPVWQVDNNDYSEPNEDVLRVAIAGVLSPTRTLEYYQELLAFIGKKLGRRVVMILKPTYSEVNDLIREGRADIAFVCSLAYVKGKQDFGMELLVVPRMYGGTVYYSYLIVPKASNATGLQDLRGTDFAFTDPISNSGHLAPVYQLYLIGAKPASFFNKYIFTYSHNNSITAVADNLIDGAAVDSLVYDQLMASDPQLSYKTKVIARWGPYGIPPVVVNPALDNELIRKVKDLLLNLHNSEEGSKILKSLGIDRFVVIPDESYDSIREMKTRLGW